MALAAADRTDITVRVISKGAKFIGSSMGGGQVTLRDADTGELLAKGVNRGATGDTDRIMAPERARGRPLSTPGAAKFSPTLDLDAPRWIEVSALGPLVQRQSASRVSAVQWVVSGKDLTGGDGWLLEMPGFVGEVLAPPAHLKRAGVPKSVPIQANVTMMCGCPVSPGPLWDTNGYEVVARLTRNGEPAWSAPNEWSRVIVSA